MVITNLDKKEVTLGLKFPFARQRDYRAYLLPLFLLSSILWVKLTLLALILLFVVGWYAILKASLFSTLKGRSGMAQALSSVSGILGKFIPFGIGLAAQTYGLQAAMWLLLCGPLALMIGLSRHVVGVTLNDDI